MLSLIGIPMIAAAWALPALFLLIIGTLIAFVVGRPVFLAWGRGFDRVAGYLARIALRFAESLAARSYDHAVRHVGRDR
jgi:membrane protein implicated in regulation of membrane protease activity